MLTYFGDKHNIHLHDGEPELELHLHVKSLHQYLFDMAQFDCRLGETLEYVTTVNFKNERITIRYIPASFRFKLLDDLVDGRKQYTAEDQLGKKWRLRLNKIKHSYNIGVRFFKESDWLLISATHPDENTVYYNVYTNYINNNPNLKIEHHIFKNSGVVSDKHKGAYIFDVASKI